MSILKKIVEKKKERLSAAKNRISLAELKSVARDMQAPRDFTGALKRGKGGIRFITEIKRASPSGGLIRTDFDHLAIAAVYEHRKVDAISVITEADFFQGQLSFLSAVKKATTRPILRKDFIVDDYQIYEARANGADAVLLIAAILDERQAQEYLHLSADLGLAVLFEVHDGNELDQALAVDAPIIGINNRDLKTMKIDLNTSVLLRTRIPTGKIVVGESGISSRNDVLALDNAGLDALLVGTVLMKSPDIGSAIDNLRGS